MDYNRAALCIAQNYRKLLRDLRNKGFSYAQAQDAIGTTSQWIIERATYFPKEDWELLRFIQWILYRRAIGESRKDRLQSDHNREFKILFPGIDWNPGDRMERRIAVHCALKELTPEQRLIAWHVLALGYSNRDVAKMIGRDELAVRTRLKVIIPRLQELLKDYARK